MLLQVVGSRPQPRRVIGEQSEAAVAAVAERRSHLAARMAMVKTEAFLRLAPHLSGPLADKSPLMRAADRAASSEDRVVFLKRQTVCPLGSSTARIQASPLGVLLSPFRGGLALPLPVLGCAVLLAFASEDLLTVGEIPLTLVFAVLLAVLLRVFALPLPHLLSVLSAPEAVIVLLAKTSRLGESVASVLKTDALVRLVLAQGLSPWVRGAGRRKRCRPDLCKGIVLQVAEGSSYFNAYPLPLFTTSSEADLREPARTIQSEAKTLFSTNCD